MSRIFMIKILRCFHWHAFSSLVNVLLWFYLVLACPLPSIENCLLIYYHWLECVTSTGSIMMPIWVLLKWFMCSFCPNTMFPRVPRRWHSGLFVEFWNFHTISSGCMLHVPNKMASQRLSMTKHLRGWLETYILYFPIPIPTFTLYLWSLIISLKWWPMWLMCQSKDFFFWLS